MNEKRKYIKQAFKNYVENKKAISLLPVPGQSGVDYSKPLIHNGSNENGVEKNVVSYIDKKHVMDKQVQLVKKTLEHFRMEYLAKGKKHYLYICNRFIKGMGYYRSADECDIPPSTAGFWLEEIYTVAESYADAYDLW